MIHLSHLNVSLAKKISLIQIYTLSNLLVRNRLCEPFAAQQVIQYVGAMSSALQNVLHMNLTSVLKVSGSPLTLKTFGKIKIKK